MLKHWYVYIIIAIIAELLFLICNKFKIIKSKPLRTFIVIFISSLRGCLITSVNATT